MHLLKIETSRLFSEIKNYKLDNIVSLADVFLICLGIFVGTGKDLFPGGTLVYALLGMILWRYATVCMSTSCSIIQREIRLGTLEQLMMAKYHLIQVIIIRLLATIFVETVKMSVVSVLLVLIFHIQLDFIASVGLIVSSTLICLVGTIGIGCFVASVAIVYKKANALVNSVSYFTLFFTGMILPLEILPVGFSYTAVIFPFHWCVEIIRRGTIETSFAGLLLVSSLWFVFGIMSFRRAMRCAMENGTTSQY